MRLGCLRNINIALILLCKPTLWLPCKGNVDFRSVYTSFTTILNYHKDLYVLGNLYSNQVFYKQEVFIPLNVNTLKEF